MRRTLWLSVVLASSLAVANPIQTFAQGTFIIPMDANFQTQCGVTSAYGLVWKILYENRLGGAFSGNPVNIYWVINDLKSSPNRCVPSNKHASPLPLGTAAGATGWDTGVWNDGCDLSIPNGPGAASTSLMPVVPVDYTTAWPATNIFPTTNAISHFDSDGEARPGYSNSAPANGKGQRPTSDLDNAGSGAGRFTKIQYSGGVFIIDSTDARRVFEAMRNATSYPHLQRHTSATACGFPDSSGYKVFMHQATQSFDAPVYKRMTSVPPKIALLDFGGGIKTVLTKYLVKAGLDGAINGVNMGGTPSYSTPTSGLLYDRLRAIDDLVTTGTHAKGFLNSKVGSKSRYKVFWAPHWNDMGASLQSNAGCSSSCNDPGTSASACGGGCDATTAQIANALENIAFFADQKGNGLMAECASIQAYEGSVSGDPAVSLTTKFMFDDPANPTEPISHMGGPPASNDGRNCTDPNYLSGGTGGCTWYPEPGEAFSQVGDAALELESGTVAVFRRANLATAIRRPGVKRLASSWNNWGTAAASGVGTDGAGDNGWDYVTLSQKDNDPEKATIIYIGGHDLSGNVAGTRVVLNTLLNLGADPLASDRNFAQATGFADNTTVPINMNAPNPTPTMVSSIYQVVTGTLPPGSITFSTANAKNWMWPFTTGNLRGRNMDLLNGNLLGTNTDKNGGIGAKNELNDAILWSADSQMPLPNDRNLFTYFGGVAKEFPTLSGGRKVKNDVAQLGWVPARIEHTNVALISATKPNPNCVDVVQFGDHKNKVAGQHDPGLIEGADGICDIQQAIQWTNFTPDVDLSGKHKMKASDIAKYDAEVPEVKLFMQLVRGYCYAEDSSGNPLLNPTDGDCNDTGSVGDNRAHMGGAVRSSAAVVGPSSKVQDSGAARPTVAYVGTWDGQLHAIFVGGGSGYTGPTGGRQYLNPTCLAPGPTCPQAPGDPRNAAASTFKTNWSTKFAAGGAQIPAKGTELWSFLPSSQLPWLKGNNAKVDSSPAVQDVFVDLYGDGVRRWHTILVASVGGSGREIFAFDVTNPLQPVLLWDIIGSNYRVGSFPDFVGAALFDDDITGSATPLVWENDKANFVFPGGMPDYTVPGPGLSVGKAYDFNELGGSRALSIGQMREGLEPTYAVFVSSNASGYGATPADSAGRSMDKGVVVMSLDIATGQKLWQWQQPYVTDPSKPGHRSADNTVPPPPSVRNGGDGASSLLVGDMEGRIWELDALTGRNLTAWRDFSSCVTTACNFAAYDTQGTKLAPEPITSNLAIAVMPDSATGALGPFVNEKVMIIGTGGTDWVPDSVAGKVHYILLDELRRKPIVGGGAQTVGSTACLTGPCTDWTTSGAQTAAGVSGVLQEVPPLQLTCTGGAECNRVYGNIAIAGQFAFVPLVQGIIGDPLGVSKNHKGSTLYLNLGGLATTQAIAEADTGAPKIANVGGVTVISVDRGGGLTETLAATDRVSDTVKWSIPTTGSQKLTKSLSSNQSLPYRLYNTVRRFFSQQ